MDLEPITLAIPTSDADSLISTNDPDTMANEQTWPTDEEMRDGDAEQLSTAAESELPDAMMGTTPKSLKRVPRGTSQYQAAWIVDEEDENEEGSDMSSNDGGSEGEQMQEIGLEVTSVQRGDEADLEFDRKSTVAFMDLDADEEENQCVFHSPLLSLLYS